MAGHGVRPQLDTGLPSLLTHRLQESDAGRQDGRLGVDRQVELLGGSLQDEARQGEAQGCIGLLQRGRGGGGVLNQCLPHADVLRALAGKDEGMHAWRRGRRVVGIGHG